MENLSTRKFAIISLVLLLLLVLTDSDRNSDDEGFSNDNGGHGYGSSAIDIYTTGEEILLNPSGVEDSYNWEVHPPLPEGMRLFNNSWEISDDALDAFGNRVCTISPNGGSICWDYSEAEVSFEFINPSLKTGFFSPGVFTSIVVGNSHNCAIIETLQGSNIICWGSDWDGQLGNGPGINSTGTSVIENPPDGIWGTLTAGAAHTCGTSSVGRIYCWGDGDFGQLGDGEGVDAHSPVSVYGISGSQIIDIDSGNFHNCAIFSVGEIYCWGWNGFGQLGDGTFYDSSIPVKVKMPENSRAVSLSLGGTHSCALLEKQEVFCWGSNQFRQISNSEIAEITTPNKIPLENDANISQIMAGSRHTCFSSDLFYSCIGEGMDEPEIPLGREIRAKSSGDGFNCYVFTDGEVYCDGNNEFGESRAFPNELTYFHVPKTISPGRIAGIPLTNYSTSHVVTSDTDSGAISSEISILVNFGEDIDSDGWLNSDEIVCGTNLNNRWSFPEDLDDDGVCDKKDWDDDGDGFADYDDVFPSDPSEWRDDDNDGVGKNADSFEVSQPVLGISVTLVILIALLLLEIRGALGNINPNHSEDRD